MYKYHPLSRGSFLIVIFKDEKQTFVGLVCMMRQHILPRSGLEAATWKSSTDEGFGGISGELQEDA